VRAVTKKGQLACGLLFLLLMTAMAHSCSPRLVLAAAVCVSLAGCSCGSSHLPLGADPNAPDRGDGGKHIVTDGDQDSGSKPDAHTPVRPHDSGEPPEQMPAASTETTFTARLVGDRIVIDVEGPAELGTPSCEETIVIAKLVNGSWRQARDDRRAANFGYYLDGAFVRQPPNGCSSCVPLVNNGQIDVGLAYEYVRSGTKAPPADAPDAATAPDQVDVIEMRPLSGMVRITLTYFEDTFCETDGPLTSVVTLTIPELMQGVCCPIGAAGCSSAGPGGGWAPSLDACVPWTMEYDAMSVLKEDPRGCPKLVKDYTICCGCAPDEDAGI
jgi:hypothetical protein